MPDHDWSAATAAAEEKLDGWAEHDPGGVILGLENGEPRLIATAGKGGAGLGSLGPESVFRWASVTKHIFASCLLESGAFALDMPLGEALPDLAPAPAAATIGQALAMQGGLPDPRECLTLLGFGGHARTEADTLYRWMAGLDWLNAAPGFEVAYSNGGYRLLEVALARRGFVFSEMIAAHAERLGIGMRASEHWTDPVPGLVPGHVPDDDGWSEGFQGMHLSAAGSLCGSAMDLALWLTDLMSREMFARLARPLPLASGEPTGYGLGMSLTRLGAMAVPGHGGAQAGYRAGFLCDPAKKVVLVALTNRDEGDATGIAAHVWAALCGARQELPKPAGEWAPPGLYAAGEGDLWAEVRPGSIVVRDAEEALFEGEDGWFVSNAAQSRMRLRHVEGALTGKLFHRPVRLLPIADHREAPELDGDWACGGALLRIEGRQLQWGVGPLRKTETLMPLGNGRWLFPANGRRICLQRLAGDRLKLSLARARGITYRRV
ncbi:serine hydrolase [uncultured Nitratireductor sp.]|uniref:serine hydrolase domain-containing protein n=1 Tax=uncultured Nitratireductor sp. TaxID=520953 RepID=UPI0026012B28|nr:serine hydrolase [uncultured Nitratireductor sp.]